MSTCRPWSTKKDRDAPSAVEPERRVLRRQLNEPLAAGVAAEVRTTSCERLRGVGVRGPTAMPRRLQLLLGTRSRLPSCACCAPSAAVNARQQCRPRRGFSRLRRSCRPQLQGHPDKNDETTSDGARPSCRDRPVPGFSPLQCRNRRCLQRRGVSQVHAVCKAIAKP